MKAQKIAGLLMMLLPALLLTVGPYLVGGAYWLSAIGGILLVATGATWRWPLPGSSIGIGVSILPLIISVGLVITNYEMTLIYGLIGLVPALMYLTGAIMVFTSARRADSSGN